jgi:hypothetical protein
VCTYAGLTGITEIFVQQSYQHFVKIMWVDVNHKDLIIVQVALNFNLLFKISMKALFYISPVNFLFYITDAFH